MLDPLHTALTLAHICIIIFSFIGWIWFPWALMFQPIILLHWQLLDNRCILEIFEREIHPKGYSVFGRRVPFVYETLILTTFTIGVAYNYYKLR
jgi:hypothetical protein